MENTPFLQPGFLLSVAVVVIGFVVWLVRLEGKVNAVDKRQDTHEERVQDEITAIEDEVKSDRADTREWKKLFFAHATDTKMHHNEEMFKEFRSGLDRRFNGIEGTLQDMNRKLDHISGRE